MAKAWKEVIASPQFQALTPEQQAAAQNQYFDEVVAPQAGDQASAARQQFFSAYPPATVQREQPATMWNATPAANQTSEQWGDQQPRNNAQAIGGAAVEAGKGLLQTGVNITNVPLEVIDAFRSAGAWAAGKLGMSDGTYQPITRGALPESLQPQDQYAKIGAEIGPYLIPGVGAERTATALASAASAGRGERLGTQAAKILAENAPGVLAQNSDKNDAGSLTEDLATGAAGSLAGRGLVAAGGAAIRGARGLLSREAPAAEGAAAAGRATPFETADGEMIPVNADGSPAPRAAPTSAEQGMQGVADTVGSAAERGTASRMADAAKEVRPRQEVIDAAKSLGIKEDDLLLSHVSGNQAYREFEQALKSVPGSQLAAQEGAVINKIAQQATDLTDAAGALPDKVAVNDKFLGAFQRGIGKVQDKSDQIYNQIGEQIPRGQPVEASNIVRYLDQKADELGGAEFLSSMEKKVYSAVSPVGEGASPPTYARLDNIRKQIGQALGKNSGPFRDEETGALKQLYSNLTQDQEAVVTAAGLGEKWDAAKKLIGIRTTMEDSLTGLLGKDLRGDVSTKSGLALRNLAKGDAKGFRQLMQDIPSDRIRKEVIATSLRDAFSQGSRRENEFHLPGFVDWYQGLRSSGTLPMLESQIGSSAAGRMRNLFTLSQAVRNAQSSSITTGRLSAFIKQFDDADGVLNKVYRHGKGALATSLIGQIPIVGPTLSYGAVAGMAAREAGRPARSVAADRLLSSGDFRQAVKAAEGKRLSEAAQQAVNNRVEKKLANSPAWKEFYKNLTKEEKEAVARVGVIGWLSMPSEQ